MKNKKALAAMLAAVMTLSVALTGCGSGDGGQQSSDSGNAAESSGGGRERS